jgi:hypothetical protein
MQGQAGQLERLGEEWAAAELRGDTVALDRILAEDFVAVGPRGFVEEQGRWLLLGLHLGSIAEPPAGRPVQNPNAAEERS